MDNAYVAALIALFVWWFSTGAILVVVKRADRVGGRAHLNAVLAGLPLLGLGWYGLVGTMHSTGPAGAYAAFFSALAIWGWFELAFLCGILTGPNIKPCPPGIPRWERFLRAWGTIAHSEMALIATSVVMLSLSWEAPNAFGLWTFLVLFFARVSAKLNVYLGVPNINVDFLPVPVRHLASHFRIAPMNAFFPVSITALSLAVGCWLERVLEFAPGTGEHVGFALLTALTGLALLEHWLMVLTLPDAELWRWMLPRSEEEPSDPPLKSKSYLSEDAHGL